MEVDYSLKVNYYALLACIISDKPLSTTKVLTRIGILKESSAEIRKEKANNIKSVPLPSNHRRDAETILGCKPIRVVEGRTKMTGRIQKQILKLWNNGFTVRDMAEIYDLNYDTIRRYVAQFKKNGGKN